MVSGKMVIVVGHLGSDRLDMDMKEGTVSRITPRFLAYVFRRMEVLFTVIKILEKGPGEKGFHEFSPCLYISDQLQRTEGFTGMAEPARGVCDLQDRVSMAIQSRIYKAAQQFRDSRVLFSFLVYLLWCVALYPFAYLLMVQDDCCDPPLVPAL